MAKRSYTVDLGAHTFQIHIDKMMSLFTTASLPIIAEFDNRYTTLYPLSQPISINKVAKTIYKFHFLKVPIGLLFLNNSFSKERKTKIKFLYPICFSCVINL